MEEVDLIVSPEQASDTLLDVQNCPSCTVPLHDLFHVLKDHCADRAIEFRRLGMHREADLFDEVEQDYEQIETQLNVTLLGLRAELHAKRKQ